MDIKSYSTDEITGLLREHGINTTSQRLEIARAMFSRGGHFSAEDVFALVNDPEPHVSKATVYNTLGLFAENGLIHPVIVDPAKVFYDANTAPHYHFYDVGTGMLSDISAHDVQITGLPPLPEGMRMEGVDVIVRVRHSKNETPAA
jgi:Fur family transcriptional regulator, iron response regulator